MTVTVQNLRSFVSGVDPDSLLAGQLCFNLIDNVVYVGDGSNQKASFDGTSVPGVPGQGWYSMPMDFTGLSQYFLQNPSYFGDFPTDGQSLVWSTALDHPIWGAGGGGGGNVYTLTNNDVALAPGLTVSDKIIAATGVASPDEGDTCVVTGQPGEVYQGLYIFTTEWIRVASYAYPTATQVVYDPAASGLPSINVQSAIDTLDILVTAAQNTANTANSTALSAQATALAALPKAGGTMTGAITFAGGQVFPVSGIQDASPSQKGVVQGGANMIFTSAGVIDVRAASTTNTGIVLLNDTTTSTSTTQAATAAAAKNLQDQINNLTLSNSVTLAGTLNAATGIVDSVTPDGTAAGFTTPAPLPSASAGNADYYVIVSNGGSYNPPGGGGPYAASSGDWFLSNGTTWQYLGVGSRPAYASTTTPGIVQLADNATTQSGSSGILAVTPSGLQSKVSDSTSTTSSTTIASSTAVKAAFDLGNAALPKAGGTMTGTINSQNVNVVAPYSIQFASGVGGSLNAISDATNLSISTTAASTVAVKSAYDLADAALPKAGGTMLGNITFSGVGIGIVFSDTSVINAISDSTATTSSVIAASATAVKSAYDLAAAALPLSGGTMTGVITFDAGQTFPVSGIQDATTGQKGVVQIGNNIDVLSGTISVPAATTATQGAVQVGTNIQVSSGTISVLSSSTTQAGVVQLEDTTSSTSTTLALTANQGYSLQQQINALAVSNNITLAGTIDGSTGLMITVTTEGTAKGFTVGAAMPSPALGNTEYFTIVTTPGTMTPPGGSAQAVNDGDWWLSNGTAWQYLPIGYSAPYATTTSTGVVQLATDAEVQAGVETTHAVVPSALQSKLSDSISTTSSTTIASSTAVKAAYDAAIAAQTNGPLTSDTVLYVNCTDGNDLTAARGTDKPYATITAALAAASEGDTILLSPGTFTENFTISKGVNISGTFSDQATWSGTKIIGNVVVNLVGAGVIRNLAVSDIYFISANSTSPVSITGMSPGAGGINTFTSCTFTQQTLTDTAQFAFQTSGTWTRSVYLRGCTIDGNFKHNAGTAAGASGYIVIDALQGVGNNSMYHYILTGTVEYRNPSNTIASIFQTGGVTLVNNASSGITANGAATSAVFGGTGFSYKGTAASVGTGTVYFQGGSNQGTGKVDIGANVVYGWTNLTIDSANLTVNVAAIAYTTAVPSAANAQSLTQQRPRLDLLKTASTVTAANQLGTVIDLTTGTIYSVTNFDAGTY